MAYFDPVSVQVNYSWKINYLYAIELAVLMNKHKSLVIVMLILDHRIWETMIYQRKFLRRITISSLWYEHFCSIQKTETFLTDFSGAWYQVWRPSLSAAVAFFFRWAVTLLPTLNNISSRYCGILFSLTVTCFQLSVKRWNWKNQGPKQILLARHV